MRHGRDILVSLSFVINTLPRHHDLLIFLEHSDVLCFLSLLRLLKFTPTPTPTTRQA
jgi:hypothetical protein